MIKPIIVPAIGDVVLSVDNDVLGLCVDDEFVGPWVNGDVVGLHFGDVVVITGSGVTVGSGPGVGSGSGPDVGSGPGVGSGSGSGRGVGSGPGVGSGSGPAVGSGVGNVVTLLLIDEDGDMVKDIVEERTWDFDSKDDDEDIGTVDNIAVALSVGNIDVEVDVEFICVENEELSRLVLVADIEVCAGFGDFDGMRYEGDIEELCNADIVDVGVSATLDEDPKVGLISISVECSDGTLEDVDKADSVNNDVPTLVVIGILGDTDSIVGVAEKVVNGLTEVVPVKPRDSVDTISVTDKIADSEDNCVTTVNVSEGVGDKNSTVDFIAVEVFMFAKSLLGEFVDCADDCVDDAICKEEDSITLEVSIEPGGNDVTASVVWSKKALLADFEGCTVDITVLKEPDNASASEVDVVTIDIESKDVENEAVGERVEDSYTALATDPSSPVKRK